MSEVQTAQSAMRHGVLQITLYAVIASMARLLQDTVIAWRHGVGPDVDAYFLLNVLVQVPISIALSTLTLLVGPAEAAANLSTEADRRRFRAELLGAVLVLAALALPLAWLVMQAVVGQSMSGLSFEASTLAAAQSLPMALAVSCGLMGALLSAWLVAGNRRSLTLLEALPPLVLVLALALLPGHVLFWGTTVGLLLQAVVMALSLQRAAGLVLPRLGLTSPAWRGLAQGGLALAGGQIVFSLTLLVDPFFAAGLGSGAVAAIGFANRLLVGLQGLCGIALQRAGLPLMSSLLATDPWQARRLALRWASWALLGGAVVAAAVALLSEPIVSMLFERGQFAVADRGLVASLLRWGVLQLPPFLSGLVLVTALAAARSYVALSLVSCCGLLVKLLVSALLAPSYGLIGLMLASAAMYAATALLAWLALVRTRVGAAASSHGRPA